jgi:hypothetical protein
MTDRYNTLTVALEKDIRDEDAEVLISAIKQLRGVLTVTGNVVDGNEWLIGQRVRHELGKKLWQVLYPK